MLIVKHIPYSLIEIAHIQIGEVMITLEYTMKPSLLPQNIALNKAKNICVLSDSDKEEWFNEHFYNYAHQIEFEKLTYFALVYNQTTLVIAGPDDNKETRKVSWL